MKFRRMSLVFALAQSLVACEGSDDPGNGEGGGSDGPDCVDDSHSVDLNEATGTYGLVAQDVAEVTAGLYQTEVFWVDGETTSVLTVEVDRTPFNARWVESVPNPDNENANAGFCVNRLEYDVAVHISSSDGRLDETWQMTARAEGPDTDIVSLVYAPSLDEFEGSFEPPSNAKSLRVTATIQPNAPTGVPPLRGNLVALQGGDGVEVALWPPSAG